MATDLVINIASQFLGKKSFGDAEKATKKLTGSVKSLGKMLGVSLSAGAILAFGKASVKAASQDIKAQKLLATSLKNVGLAYASVDVEAFINKMQSQTGVLDDYLRPAFSKLAGVTGSVKKTQQLMALAFDTSSGSGLDYASTVDILAQAYVGNTKGLKQLNLGLTQAEIKAMSFDDVVKVLNARFSGSGAAALDTYIGQMSLLSASASNATEIIGTSLLGAIDSLSGSDGIANVATDIENAASSLANFIDSVVYLKEQMATIPGAGLVKSAFGLIGNVLGRFSPQRAAELLKEIKGPQPFSQPMTLANQDTGRADAKAKKDAELAAIKRNKELAKLAQAQAKSAAATLKAKRDQAALDKAALVLGKGQDVFNLDAIQIQAALLSKQDEINKLGATATDQQKLQLANDLVRLTIKEDILKLEDAIAAKDVEGATKLAAKLDKDLQILGTLQGQTFQLSKINDILNSFKPKSLIDIENLNQALELLMKMAGLKFNPVGTSTGVTGTTLAKPNASAAAALIPSMDFNPYQNKDRNYDLNNAISDIIINSAASGSGQGAGRGEGQIPSAAYITINAGVIADEQQFIGLLQDGILQLNRRGDNLSTAGAL